MSSLTSKTDLSSNLLIMRHYALACSMNITVAGRGYIAAIAPLQCDVGRALEPSTSREKQDNLSAEKTKHQLRAIDHTNFDKQIQ